jgi:hypothetical protein
MLSMLVVVEVVRDVRTEVPANAGKVATAQMHEMRGNLVVIII